MAGLSTYALQGAGEAGLVPLLTLTNGGAGREAGERMFGGSLSAKKIELVPIGYTLASLAFSRENRAEQDWLLRRFHEMHDILRETPIYQEILKEGREEGLEALRQAILDVVTQRFPKLTRLAKKQVVVVEDPELLRHVLVKVSVAHTAEEAKQQLLALNEVDE